MRCKPGYSRAAVAGLRFEDSDVSNHSRYVYHVQGFLKATYVI